MNKKTLLFAGLMCMAQIAPSMAITIKKAAPVATKQNDIKETGASLIPTVIGLYSGIQEITQKQKTLIAECLPSSQEIEFVNSTFKEWIKTGAMTRDEVFRSLGNARPCQTASGGYATSVSIAYATEDTSLICYDFFGDSSDKNMIWYGYPKAVTTYYCTDDPSSRSCTDKNRENISNIYDIFNLIDFTESDYTKQEAKMAGTLIAKIENCSNNKLNAKKRAMWSEFLVGSISSLGSKTNTGTIMQMVQGSANSGPMGALKSLGGNVTQFLQ